MSEKAKEVNSESEESRVYEIGYLLIPNLSSEEVADTVNGIRDLVEGAGGAFISSENPKLLRLAYSMEKTKEHKKHAYEEAYFGWIKFHADTGATLEMKSKLDLDDNIIRFIIVKTTLEDTRVPKRSPVAKKAKPAEKEKSVEQVSEVELDKAIDELVQ